MSLDASPADGMIQKMQHTAYRAVTLGEALRRALNHKALTARFSGWEAVEAWPEIVGTRIAERTRAVDFRDGQLIVEVEGTSWLAELVLLRRTLLQRLTERIGSTNVTTIRFVQSHDAGTRSPDLHHINTSTSSHEHSSPVTNSSQRKGA
jgi:predicted nucleic acid-binding Zn ribbon protein